MSPRRVGQPSGTRYPHQGITASDRRQAHIDWLKLIEVSGPFLSVPVLTAEWPDLEPLDTRARDRLRQQHRQWQEDAAGNAGSWINFVLDDLLGWNGAVRRDEVGSLALDVPEHETTIIPSFTLADPGTGEVKLIGLVSEGSPAARVKGSDWPATPADRIAQLCRHHCVELGLATDGRWWALVWAPAGGVTTLAVFDAISWPESSERDVVRAFISLLQRRRFFAVPPERQLPALLRESLYNQEEITDRLGVQVRQAVELLVASFGRADAAARDRGQPGLAAVSAYEVYRGAVAVMMRIVFLLFAEESGLLPADNELYARAYSAGGLYAELERRVADARGNEGELEHTYLAWHRLLALFTVTYRGIDHPELDLIAHDGSLFDPDGHPWLEGRVAGTATPGIPLPVDDRTVLHMLRAVQTVTIAGELRTVSFRTLTVEQIGYVYEGLLSFEGFRAADVTIGLIGKDGREDEVPLTALEDLATAYPDDSVLAAQLAGLHKDSGIGSAKALAAKLAPLTSEENAQAEARLFAVTRDHDLVDRLRPFYRIIRQDLRGDPVVILPGALYVTESALRASTGAHYTPRFLAEQVAEGALEPLVYLSGPLQTADRSAWRLRSSEEILALKVADIAMGSGAFLVAACRYLAGKLIEAWSAEGDPQAQKHVADELADGLALDSLADTLVIDARRQVIEHCLYGVDINPMAVEMAKLSLWLVSMDPRRPFTFLDDRLVTGDSLLGITSAEQLEWMHLHPSEGRKLHETAVLFDWTAGVRELLAEVAADRLGLVDIVGSDIEALNKKRQILASVQARTEDLARYADLIAGAALAGARRGNLWMTAAQTASKAAADGAIEDAVMQAREWLATDQPAGGFDRQPLHWPLIFPEVFDPASPHGPGFDAIVGNPPFLGGPKIRPTLGSAYREVLVTTLGEGVRATNADLIAFFALRAHQLLNGSGQAGLIGTNSLAQGDTREAGLDQITAQGVRIRQAIKSAPWPSRSAAVQYCAVWTSRAPIAQDSIHRLDGMVVKGITSTLDAESRVAGQPFQIAANQGMCHYGSDPYGMGFTLTERVAQEMIREDSRNAKVLSPFLNGEDVNSKSDSSASRWIVNFFDWDAEEAATYRAPFDHVNRYVRSDRATKSDAVRKWAWWKYWRSRPELYAAISGRQRVIVIARVSKAVMPTIVPARQVFSNALAVFATEDTGMLALVSSAPHYWWAIRWASTMKGDLRYTPADVFGTLPLPRISDRMRELGGQLDSVRRELMLAMQSGLTVTYNLVHDANCTEVGIAELREIHRKIDAAVVRAYGWDDLLAAGLDHGFHETRQGPRYTIGATVRQEILDRLLELNHERYAEEQRAGLHNHGAGRRAVQRREGETLF